ncbi:hypothetical protein HBE96_16125 [Clostridium sp. P21]|uniref:Uncharacterized protein n=1 Tax=Clostridium muellerianum TaxID=2716538 RepID=A0A7Y0HQH0_9CLOT|nr:hypothetical protein [Clostridium muellerianum]NMM64156.1 hypothetical protein [Clostridium muellerianum]
MEDLKMDYGLKVIIPDNVEKQMEERLILRDDVEKTLFNAQKNKERFRNTQNSHYLTRMRIGSVTYWVEYGEKNDKLLVYDVYTHRMEIVEA